MKRINRTGLAAALCMMTAFGAAGCGKQGNADGTKLVGTSVHSARIVVDGKPVRSGVRALSNGAGSVWFPLEDVGESLGYQTVQQQGQYVLGGTDAAYTVMLNRKEALLGDQPVLLPDPPTLVQGRPYVSAAALTQLTSMPIQWDSDRSQLVITPSAARTAEAGGGAAAAQRQTAAGGGAVRSLGVGKPDPQQLISYAETFKGTPYRFSSGPYEQTGTFDCSSFMQHIYGHFGVILPRSSIQQSNVGQTVPDGNLQPGDLMFFYTPGRYDNNRTVGHVGMYIGGNRFINTYGAPGVVITDFNDYWHGRFLFAKRVL